MESVRISFERLDGVTPNEMMKGTVSPVYDHFNIHVIFDINIDGKLTRK